MNPNMTKQEVIDALSGVDQVDDLFRPAETTEQHWERVARINEAINEAISMLQNATIWTPCSERMPTREDGVDVKGWAKCCVNIVYPNGIVVAMPVLDAKYNNRLSPIIAWSRIEPIGGGNG